MNPRIPLRYIRDLQLLIGGIALLLVKLVKSFVVLVHAVFVHVRGVR